MLGIPEGPTHPPLGVNMVRWMQVAADGGDTLARLVNGGDTLSSPRKGKIKWLRLRANGGDTLSKA